MVYKNSPVTVIAIGGRVATGTSQVSSALAKSLGWPKHSGGDSMRALRKAEGLEHVPLEEFGRGRDQEIDDANRNFVLNNVGGCVLEARLVLAAVRGIESARTVLLTCDDGVRFEREAQRRGCDVGEAMRLVRARDKGDEDRLLEVYGVRNIFNHDQYDCTLSTSRLTVEQSAQRILEFICRM